MQNSKDRSGAKTMSDKDMKKTKGGLAGLKVEAVAEEDSLEKMSMPKAPVGTGTIPKLPVS